MDISAIFSDYDGTLAPDDVSMDASKVPKEVEEPLSRLSSSVPVAIVTSKDYAFVRPRTQFARAWACVSGLEIVLSDGRAFATPPTGARLREGLEYVRRHDKFGLAVELKRSTTKSLLGFSVHWRKTMAAPVEFIDATTARLTDMGMTVAYDPVQPFLDVFGARPDKGRAVREMRTLLGVSGNIVYIGDSVADNSAFEEADVGICISHGQSLDALTGAYVLRYEELGAFLSSLADDGMSLNLRSLRRR